MRETSARRARLAAFSRWFPAEQDLRGHDPVLGWLHAVAHGADLLGSFGTHAAVRPTDMTSLATERLLARNEYVFAQQDDDRLAQAMALVLTRPEVDEHQALAWLDTAEYDFEGLPSGPLPRVRRQLPADVAHISWPTSAYGGHATQHRWCSRTATLSSGVWPR